MYNCTQFEYTHEDMPPLPPPPITLRNFFISWKVCKKRWLLWLPIPPSWAGGVPPSRTLPGAAPYSAPPPPPPYYFLLSTVCPPFEQKMRRRVVFAVKCDSTGYVHLFMHSQNFLYTCTSFAILKNLAVSIFCNS